MKYHVVYAALAVLGFVWHLVANLLVDLMWWLPEYIWLVSVVFSVLAIYAGAVTAARTDGRRKATAIASAVVGGIVLLALLISGATWLFLLEGGYDPFGAV